MNYQEVYVGLGGNIGDSVAILRSAIEQIKAIPNVIDFKISSFYETPPVSDIPQRNYVNAVCKFLTSLEPDMLFLHLQHIEKIHGKNSKQKNAPRKIDLDILFYGDEYYNVNDLEIPHPRWSERLFVLIPLLELTAIIGGINIKSLIDTFPKKQQQEILRLIPKPQKSEAKLCIASV